MLTPHQSYIVFLTSVGCYRLLLLFINNCLIKVDVKLFHSRGGFVSDILSQTVDKFKKDNPTTHTMANSALRNYDERYMIKAWFMLV